MKIAIVHYHLNRGGVTQVIVNHLRSLSAASLTSSDIEVAILYGGRRQGWPEGIEDNLAGIRLKLVPVAGLDYDAGPATQPEHLADEMVAALEQAGMPAKDTPIHIHNHSLGKNVSFLGAVAILAKRGCRLLLHVHDFAEDFRPDNYRLLEDAWLDDDRAALAGHLYPQAEQIHYATLTRRDFDLLSGAGVPLDRLHLLPNPVFDFGELPDRAQARAKLRAKFGVPESAGLSLYPVRGIRRKNVGEALLWSVLAEGDMYVGMTLEPLNPVELASYQAWRNLVDELRLPCVFGLGESDGLSFKENLACADAILTTSVKEGFGMVFAEAWLAGRPLMGRDLPDITRDFVDAGMNLDTLRPRLDVPLSAVGRDDVVADLCSVFGDVLAAYRRTAPPTEELNRSISEILRDEKVDFALLTPTLQRRVVRSSHMVKDVREQIRRLNPWFDEVIQLSAETAGDLVRRNAEVVRQKYCLAECGRRLAGVYRAVADSGTGALQPLQRGERILDFFLQLELLRPVCMAT